MASTMRNITVDCTNAVELGRFWAQVLGWSVFSYNDAEVVVAPSFPSSGAMPTMTDA